MLLRERELPVSDLDQGTGHLVHVFPESGFICSPCPSRQTLILIREVGHDRFLLFLTVLLFTNSSKLLYKTLIRPVVPYGVETWTLKKKEEQALLIFERKIFRRICGPQYENGGEGEWKIRTNRELEEMNKGANIVKCIKGQRISWLGHLERMDEDRVLKKSFTQELEGTRRRGRPRKEWKEEVEGVLQVLGVRRWREFVADRKKWKDFVRQAKAHSGL